MKNLIRIAIMMMCLTWTACGGDNNTKTLQDRIDSLNLVINRQQTDMDDMTHTLDVVAEGIDSIHRQENIIYTGIDEVTGKKLSRKEIRKCIKELQELLKRQRERITLLEDSLYQQNDKRVVGLRSVIASLNEQLQEKERTIKELEAKVRTQTVDIQNLSASVERLAQDKQEMTEHIQVQEEALTKQDEIINEGYYIIGTRKELKSAGLITTTMLGLGKSMVNLEQADLSKMKKIDIRNFSNEIVISGKKAKILSHMPENSYAIVSGDTESKLYIKDAALFWSMSKILVIEIK